MDGIILKDFFVEKNKINFNFRAVGEIGNYFTTDTMFIEYEEDMTGVPKSILVIPFVASILPLMWLTNTVLWVEEVDKTFYYAIQNLKVAYQNLYSHYPLKGNFVAAKVVDNTYNPIQESLLLFSGGIDANTTYIRILDKNPVLFNIQGWYKNLTDYNSAAEADIRDVKKFAEKEKRVSGFAKSNFAVLIDNKIFNKNIKKKFGDSWWHGFQHSMSFISIAIPYAFKHKIKDIYIASSVPMGEYVMCASHVTTDMEFKFAQNGGCVHDGSELTRQDKVHVLVEHANKINDDYQLRVCSFNDKNCCVCDKCFRSILGIVAEAGDIKKFGFYIDTNLKDHFEKLMEEKAQTFNIRGESKLHWPAIKKRMQENYESISEKEFVDWFLNYDFFAARKKALYKYYRTNFWSIVKRKLSR